MAKTVRSPFQTKITSVLSLVILLVVVSVGVYMSKDFGIKVSQDGKDARTGADSEMVMNSNFNSFKIVKSGTVTIPGNVGGTVTTIVPHNLDFVPAFQCYLLVAGTETHYQIPYTQIDAVTGAVNILTTAYADDTNIYFETIVTAVGTQPWTIRYYLLQETAN